MPMVRDQRVLRKIQDQIRKDLAKLVNIELRMIYEDAGNSYDAVVPSLLSQLEDSIQNGSERARGIKRGKTIPLVIAVQAFDIMRSIELVAKEWGKGTVEERIRNRVSEVGQYTVEHIGEVRDLAWHLEIWVIQITNLLDPPRHYDLAAPCPECNSKLVKIFQTFDKEYVFQSALQILSVNGKAVCECLACGSIWPESHFYLLANVLGCDPVV